MKVLSCDDVCDKRNVFKINSFLAGISKLKEDSYLGKAITIFIFLLILFLRVHKLEIDPPGRICYSSSLYLREGICLHDASRKNMGKKTDADFKFNTVKHIENNKILSYIQYVNLKFFSDTLKQLRIPYALLSVLGIYFFFLGVREEYPFIVALTACSLLGFNYIYVAYNRMAIEETPMIFLVLLSFFFWQKGLKKRLYRIITPFFIFLAIYIKSMALIIIPVFFLVSIFSAFANLKTEKRKIDSFIPLFDLFVGSAVFLSLFVCINYLMTGSFVDIFDFIRNAVGTFGALIPNTKESIFSFFWRAYFTNSGLISILSYMILPFIVLDCWHNPRNVSNGELVFFTWIVVGFLGMNLTYIPENQNVLTRYFVNIIPPMVGLISIKLNNFAFHTEHKDIHESEHVIVPFLDYFFVMFCLFPLLYFFTPFGSKTYTLIFFAVTLFIYPIINEHHISHFLKGLAIKNNKIFSVFIIVTILIVNTNRVRHWFLESTKIQTQAIENLRDTFKEGTVMIGKPAFFLSLGTNLTPVMPREKFTLEGESEEEADRNLLADMKRIDYIAAIGTVKDGKFKIQNEVIRHFVEKVGVGKVDKSLEELSLGKYVVKFYKVPQVLRPL